MIGKEGRCPISVGAVEVGDLPLTSVGGREWEGRCSMSIGAAEVGDLPLTSVGGREWEGRCPMSVGAAPPTRPEAAKSEQPPQTIEENSFLDKNKSQRKWEKIF